MLLLANKLILYQGNLVWSLFKGNGSAGEPIFLSVCWDAGPSHANSIPFWTSRVLRPSKFTVLQLTFKTHIFIFCAFMELCSKLIIFDKLDPTGSFNRTSCFLYWFQSRVVLRAFHRLVAWDIHCALFCRSVRGLGWTLPLPLCLNERSWHSHWFCGLLFQYLQPFTCCNKVHWSFFDVMCFLCAEPLVAFVFFTFTFTF